MHYEYENVIRDSVDIKGEIHTLMGFRVVCVCKMTLWYVREWLACLIGLMVL